jgi:hypothetical protein
MSHFCGEMLEGHHGIFWVIVPYSDDEEGESSLALPLSASKTFTRSASYLCSTSDSVERDLTPILSNAVLWRERKKKMQREMAMVFHQGMSPNCPKFSLISRCACRLSRRKTMLVM